MAKPSKYLSVEEIHKELSNVYDDYDDDYYYEDEDEEFKCIEEGGEKFYRKDFAAGVVDATSLVSVMPDGKVKAWISQACFNFIKTKTYRGVNVGDGILFLEATQLRKGELGKLLCKLKDAARKYFDEYEDIRGDHPDERPGGTQTVVYRCAKCGERNTFIGIEDRYGDRDFIFDKDGRYPKCAGCNKEYSLKQILKLAV